MKRPDLPKSYINFFNLSEDLPEAIEVDSPNEMATVSSPVASPVLEPILVNFDRDAISKVISALRPLNPEPEEVLENIDESIEVLEEISTLDSEMEEPDTLGDSSSESDPEAQSQSSDLQQDTVREFDGRGLDHSQRDAEEVWEDLEAEAATRTISVDISLLRNQVIEQRAIDVEISDIESLAQAPDVISSEAFELSSESISQDSAHASVSQNTVKFYEFGTSRPSVTFHKHGKHLLVKANDIHAADIWREIKARLKNQWMGNLQYFDNQAESEVVAKGEFLYELWRWVEDGLEDHPYFKILESYGVDANISPSLAGYMKKEKRRVAIMSTPFPCYESSPDDITETIISGMILKCKVSIGHAQGFIDGIYHTGHGCFQEGARYMVKGLTETGKVEVYSGSLQSRTALADDSEIEVFSKADIQKHFEDSDKFVITENIREKYPDLVANIDAKLDDLVIGEPGRLFDHVRQDIGGEVLKGDFLCSYSMRLAKTSNALAACELIGSKKRAWIGPAVATIDIPAEFTARGVTDFKEITSISDLDDPASYHIITMDFLKKNDDPLQRVRRGNTAKTWLRLVGEGKSKLDCPHCDQPLERSLHVKSVDGRIIHTSWTLNNGYLCRNPFCIWTEVNSDRKRPRLKLATEFRRRRLAETPEEYAELKLAHDEKFVEYSATPWHGIRDVKAITHQGGYIDWERKQHALCGDHVGRKRICPKCKLVDAAWTPAIYKRIKKDYNTVVLDEIHLTKAESSKTSKAALDMRGKHHIGNSGTPMSNNLVDMFPQFMWLFHTKSKYFPFDRVHGKTEFKERFCENIKITRLGTDRSHYKTLPYARDPLDFWNFAAPLLVRRTVADPVYQASLRKLGLFSPKEETFVMPVHMVAPQALLLSGSIDKFKADFADYCMELEEEGKSLNSHIVMTMMSRMKIGATIPGFLNKPDQPRMYEGGSLDPLEMGGKGVALATLIPTKIMDGKKIVLMSQYVLMRARLTEKFASYNPVLMPSGSVAKKREALDSFRNDSTRQLAIVGPDQVSMGVELNCADILIIPDLMWKAGAQMQALARLMGPTPYERTVEVYILNSQYSIDEHVYNVFYGKIAGMEQALDKRVVTRSAQSVNWVAFADTVVAQKAALEGYFRDSAEEEEGIYLPNFAADDDLLARFV